MTAGWKTSEFWMHMLVLVGSVATTAAGILPAKIAAIAATVSTVAYSLARGLAKVGSGGLVVAEPEVVSPVKTSRIVPMLATLGLAATLGCGGETPTGAIIIVAPVGSVVGPVSPVPTPPAAPVPLATPVAPLAR